MDHTSEVAAETGISLKRYAEACEKFDVWLAEKRDAKRARTAHYDSHDSEFFGCHAAADAYEDALDAFRALLNGDAI